MNIKFHHFKITNVKQSSGIFSGDNSQVRWKDKKKVDEGFGSLIGTKNISTDNQHVVRKHSRKANETHSKQDELLKNNKNK